MWKSEPRDPSASLARRVARVAPLCAVAICIGTWAAATSTARAQTREPPAEAIDFFASGRAHYEAGRYREASADLERALALDPGSPTLIFNLARIYELLGELDKAIVFGRQYLATLPTDAHEERERAESTLRRMEGAKEWLALREASRPPELRNLAPTVVVHERGVADMPFWILLASGVGVTAVGGALGIAAWVKRNEAHDFVNREEGDRSQQMDLADRADRLALATDIVVGVGLAASLGALLLYLLRVRTFTRSADEAIEEESDLAQIQWELSPARACLAVEGHF